MGTKIPPATKRMVYAKLRDGLSARQVADITGVSQRTVERMKASMVVKQAMPARTASTPGEDVTPPTTQDRQEENEAKTTLDFEESPVPIEKKGPVESALSSLKGMLGINEEKEPKKPLVLSAKLNQKQQQFVDAASPTVSLAAMSLAAWLWGRIGPEYSMLAPDEKVAQRIVEPLLRVYARHANFLTDIHPDVADIGASMFALVGYVHVSLGIYQQIKREKEEYEQGYERSSNVSGINNGRRTAATQSENGAGNESSGYADVRRAGRPDAPTNGSNGRAPGNVNQLNLSDKEARQHAALSRLAELDYLHRARRSGRIA